MVARAARGCERQTRLSRTGSSRIADRARNERCGPEILCHRDRRAESRDPVDATNTTLATRRFLLAVARPHPASHAGELTLGSDPPFPPFELAQRVGSLVGADDPEGLYDEIGSRARDSILALLPDGW